MSTYIYSIVYSIMLFILLMFNIYKRKNKMGIFLLLVYFIISLFLLIAIKFEIIDQTGVKLLPYLFLILCYVIFFSPFLTTDKNLNCDKFSYGIDKKSTIFSWFYISCSFITIKCFLPSVLSILASGNWMGNRTLTYTGEITFPYSNIIEYISINVTEYLSILAILIGISFLRNKKNTKLGIMVLSSVFISMLLRCLYSSARGPLLQMLLFLLSIYFFFYKEINIKNRIIINRLVIIGCCLIVPLMLNITNARFGSGSFESKGMWKFDGKFSSSTNSLIFYFGHAPLVFNNGVSIMNGFALGKFGFGKLLGLPSISQIDYGGNWGTSFFTFVGWLYIDWGPIGVILIGIIFATFFRFIIKKRRYDLADAYLILFYYQTLLYGVFVIGSGYIFNILIAVATYIFLKIFVSNKKYIFGKYEI
ncbi:MAG: oligosaccharide repeat unit polymerase [Coprobacillus cateniformis]|nr:oligosaccharide repeat unit polymerase [Coprobacillus cateniformis]